MDKTILRHAVCDKIIGEKEVAEVDMRGAGILLPIFSLHSPYGIGCFSQEAYEFIDFLNDTGQRYWQILPLGPTGYRDSPYQSLSTYAGNPYFIDLQNLVDRKRLKEAECREGQWRKNPCYIDYGSMYIERRNLLRDAYHGYDKTKDFKTFVDSEKWLEDFALFMAVKEYYKGAAWHLWDEGIKHRKTWALAEYREKLAAEMDFYRWEQYVFFKQWNNLKAYAGERGINIIGDLPFYVAYDSVDCWCNTPFFQLDKDKWPLKVAGCPPDYFAETGQRWGNPIYSWGRLRRSGYRWWIDRIKRSLDIYDIVRIDHFRGFKSYYAINPEAKTAEHGCWEKGPGLGVFRKLENQGIKLPVIAEDLGELTEDVKKMTVESGFPGMKVLEFAFSSDDGNLHSPHRLEKNSVVYTSTHDNDTVKGWYETLPAEGRRRLRTLAGRSILPSGDVPGMLIAMAHQSLAETCIISMQDYLCLGTESRINVPGTQENNWKWRLVGENLNKELKKYIKDITKLCGR